MRIFAFVDLCGFTAYTEAHGEGAAVTVLAHLRTTLRASAEARGVRVTKWLRDGAMLSGVDTAPVVECVIETRDKVAGESPVPLRAGIARGRVIMFEGDDYVGAAVNMAARLAARAAPNQILTTVGVAELVAGSVPLQPMQPVHVGGVASAVGVRELPHRTAGARSVRAPVEPVPSVTVREPAMALAQRQRALVEASVLRCPSRGGRKGKSGKA